MRKTACRALRGRWSAILSVAAQDALAATLMEEGVSLLDGVGGGPVTLTDVLGDFSGDFAVAAAHFLSDACLGLAETCRAEDAQSAHGLAASLAPTWNGGAAGA